MSSVIRLLLVDDHAIVRESLRDSLLREPDILVVGEAADGAIALQRVREQSPDVVVTDISMPILDGFELVKHIVTEYVGVRVLVLSTHLDRHFIQRMFDAGAMGYVSKSAGRVELLQGIRSVALSRRYLCQECALLMATTKADEDHNRLGQREVEVLKMIALGHSSAEIGKRLFIATGTAEVHRRNILRKLNLHDVAGLTRYAIREGLISPSDTL
jgi:two-component system NarL family response regulator